MLYEVRWRKVLQFMPSLVYFQKMQFISYNATLFFCRYKSMPYKVLYQRKLIDSGWPGHITSLKGQNET